GSCADTGARAGHPFGVTVDSGGAPRDRGGLVEGEPVLAGQIVRVLTTGGGGWGDALTREPELVARDVVDGKGAVAAAREEYGVVVVAEDDGGYGVDATATEQLRKTLRDRRT